MSTIAEMDACARANDLAVDRPPHNAAPRISISSNVSSYTSDEEDYATAQNSVQRESSSSGGGGSGLGISGFNRNSIAITTTNASTTTANSSSRRASAPMMGANATITAAAAEARMRGMPNWPGEIMRQTDVRVESRELDERGTLDDRLGRLDAELRRRSRLHYTPREARWTRAGEYEALSELAQFLRDVTPPPDNFMSVPSPSPTNTTTTGSLRRRKSGRTGKRGALMRVVRLFSRVGTKKKALVRSPSSASSRAKKRPASSGLKRSHSVKRKRPPRIKLPDTAVAGRTVDGHRHIAISIPIEHAHLGMDGYPSPINHNLCLSRSLSSSEAPSPRVYTDINYSIQPLTAFVAEPHIGTQLGPLVEERESLSSRSFEKGNGGGGGSSNGSNGGGANTGSEAAFARKVRLASRNTFGTVHEESGSGSRPTTAPAQPSPGRSSEESGGGGAGGTPRTSDEMRSQVRRQTLAALAGSGGAGGPPGWSGPGPQQRPASAHSFRSFATPSAGKVYYPMRKSSLHPAGTMAVALDTRRPRTMSNTTGGTNYSRDSSRDQTLQESIFSERSYLESLVTVDSTGNLKEDVYPSPVQVSEATFARRFDGRDVIEFSPRNSTDSPRRQKRESGSSTKSASSREKKRMSGSPRRPTTGDKGKQRASYEAPVVVVRPNRNSGGSVEEGPVVIVQPETRHSSGSASSAIFGIGNRKSEPAPAVVSREPASAASIMPKERRKSSAGKVDEVPEPPTSGRQSRFVEGLEEAPVLYPQAKKQEQEIGEQGEVQRPKPEIDVKGKGKEIEAWKHEAPMIEVQRATPTQTQPSQLSGDSPESQRRSTSKGRADETSFEQPAAGALDVWRKTSLSRKKAKDKGKKRETSQERTRPDTPDEQTTGDRDRDRDISSPLPSPKDRRERKKSVLLSRKQRVAALKAALDKPGSQPRDLVWERRLSASSTSSSELTFKVTKMSKKRDSFPYAPTTLSPIPPRVPKRLSLAKILTVADVRPSTPDFDLARKNSIPVSISSPATVSTIMKTSPVPPYRSLGSVTPPESPTDHQPVDSPTSQSSTIDADAQSTSLRQRPSSPRSGRITRRRSGRTSPMSSTGRRSPVPTQVTSPPRPKTAGKGALASSKNPFSEGSGRRSSTPQSDLDESDTAAAGRPSTAPASKSILKMSRSEIFDRYEALREKQTRDMERRIRRLEKNGDYFLSSMLPILTDMSQTLKIAVGNNSGQGKGKEAVDGRERTPTRYDGQSTPGRRREQSDERVRPDAFALESDEDFVSHIAAPSGRPRLYLHDDVSLNPALGYRIDRPSPSSDARSRSFSPYPTSKFNSRLTSLATEARQQQRDSGSNTMVDSTTTGHGFGGGGGPSSKRASASSRLGDMAAETERIARLEKITERIDAEIRRFPLVNRKSSPAPPTRAGASRDGQQFSVSIGSSDPSSESSLRTYQGTDGELSTMEEHWSRQRGGEGRGSGGGGSSESRLGTGLVVRGRQRARNSMDTIEPLMRELQVVGGKVSLESADSAELGDNEVRRMRRPPGPRAVVGFGAFSM